MIFTKTEIEIAKQIAKAGFIIVALCILLILVTNVMDSVGTVSLNKVDTQVKKEVNEMPPQKSTVKAEAPSSIEIPGYVSALNVQTPVSTSVDVLDAALGRGAVYYPGSGYPGSNNTLVFGHSTTFKIVRNKAYQVFNNIKSVPAGTLIYVKTGSTTHIYKTRSVSKVSKYTSWIQFKSDTPILTLATCDSFGKASDRWVLVADYVGVK